MAKSRIISVRLHPDNPYECKALEILEKKQQQGLDIRQVVTDAICRVDGITPEMFDNYDEESVSSILSILLDEVRQQGDQIVELLLSMKNADPTAFRAFANAETDDEARHSITPEFADYLRDAARKSRRQLSE